MKNLSQFVSSIYFILILSCTGTHSGSGVSLQERFNIGMENLEREKYLQAQTDFKYVVMRGTGTDLGDDAQYYLGESYYKNKEYLLAVAEYEKLTRKMAFSPFVEDARFKICESYRIESPKYYHDQEYTEKAIERYQEFLDDFPESKLNDAAVKSIENLRGKLGKKIYETGILYMKLDEFESAKMTFQSIMNMYYDTEIIQLAYQGMVEALARNREIDEAKSLLSEHENVLVESGLYNKAAKTIEKMQRTILKASN